MLRNELAQQTEISALQQRMIVFRVGGQAYGLPLLSLREILPVAKLSHLPAMPTMLAGLLNLGGEAVAVVHAARFFGCAESPLTLYSPILLLRDAEPPLALLVDAVDGLAVIDQAEIVPLRDSVCLNDCARGLIRVGDEHVVLLDDRRLISQEESRRLAEWTSHEQTRLAELQEGTA